MELQLHFWFGFRWCFPILLHIKVIKFHLCMCYKILQYPDLYSNAYVFVPISYQLHKLFFKFCLPALLHHSRIVKWSIIYCFLDAMRVSYKSITMQVLLIIKSHTYTILIWIIKRSISSFHYTWFWTLKKPFFSQQSFKKTE